MSDNKSSTGPILRILMPLLLILSIVEFHIYQLPQAMLGSTQKESQALVSLAHPWGTLIHIIAASLTVAALILVASGSWSGKISRTDKNRLPLVLVLALLATAVFQIATVSAPSIIALHAASILIIGYMALRFFRGEHNWVEKAVVALFAVYQLIPRFVLAAAAPLPPDTYKSLKLLAAGEVIMVVAFIALIPVYIDRFLKTDRLKKIRPLIVASAVAVLLSKFYLDDPTAMALSFSRASGLQLVFPFTLYILAIWALIFTATTLKSNQGRGQYTGYALVFIFLSGFLPLNPYQHLLTGLGFTLLGMKNRLQGS